jgi:amicoumacin kinase
MDPTLLASACTLYQTEPDLLCALSGGHYNAVYQFPAGEKPAILRIGVEDCPPDQTLGMLEWVRFLSREGAPVSAPIPSVRNRLLENLNHYGTRYTLTAFEKVDGILAENIPSAEWTDDLFTNIGRAVGRFHGVSSRFKPARPSRRRLQWFESDEIQKAIRLLSASSDPGQEILIRLVAELKQLPSSAKDYGLIHDDLHFANFIVRPDGMVTIIDFDDCAYGWFAMDVAMALFDVLVLYNPPTEAERRQFAWRFLGSYLRGYRQEKDLPPFWISQIPHFLKLKELCVYATLIGHPEIDQPNTWVGRFMNGRSERIANDIAYMDIDFSNL